MLRPVASLQIDLGIFFVLTYLLLKGLQKGSKMDVVHAVMSVLMLVWTINFLIGNYRENGGRVRSHYLAQFAVCVVTNLVCVGLLILYPRSGDFFALAFQTTFGVCLIAIALPYFWYVGFLSGVRRQYVDRLRVKWQSQLDWLNEQDDIHKAREEMSKLISPKTLYEALRQTYFKKDMKKRKALQRAKAGLEWKLEHIVPWIIQ